MQIRPYHTSDRDATIDFAMRLERRNRKAFDVPNDSLNFTGDDSSREQLILALDENGVHGGYCLRSDPYHLDGERVQLNYFGFPVSEGIIDRSYATVGLALQQDIQHRVEIAYGLGGGGIGSRVNQLKIRGGWSACDIPFFLYVNRPLRVLRHLPILQCTRLRKFVSCMLATSGLGTLGLGAVQFVRARQSRLAGNTTSYRIVRRFPNWVDQLHGNCISSYRLMAQRDLRALEERFPHDAPNVSRCIVLHDNKPIGWFVTINQIHNKRQHFGHLKVGLITDFLSLPTDAHKVVWAATNHLRKIGVDLIVGNTSHRDWISAFRQSGYFRGPSNFPFLASPKLSQRMGCFKEFLDVSHIVRADGDAISAMLPVSVEPLCRAS